LSRTSTYLSKRKNEIVISLARALLVTSPSGSIRAPVPLGILVPLVLLITSNECPAQTLSIFANAVPANAAVSYTGAITLGVKFWSPQSGTISAIRFYRGATSPQGYVASLYSASGSLLSSVTMAEESDPVPGWQQAVFPVPIALAANTTYVAAYYAPTGQYAAIPKDLTQTASNGPLHAPAASLVGGNGVYQYNRGFPALNSQGTNYLVDIAFVPTERYLSITSDRPNPTVINTTPLGTVVAHLAATWSDGAPFTGTLSFGPPNFNHGGAYELDSNNNLIISPLGPGVGSAGGSTHYVTIVATQ
jgi:Domain of unknown function (DUF4082)